MEVCESLSQRVLEEVAEFSAQREDLSCVVKPLHSLDSFASTLFVGEVNNKKTSSKVGQVVIKMMPDSQHMRDMQNSDVQFYNEDVMFTQILPMMVAHSSQVASLFPKCLHARHDGDNALIVMENLAVEGYVLSGQLLDYDHCRVTFAALGRFHAVSYAMKHRHIEDFQTRVVDIIKVQRYTDQKRNDVFMSYTAMDPVHHIRNSTDPEMIAFREEHKDFLDKLEEALQQTSSLLETMMIPEEPLAVLCHGDFNRNNLMYRYDQKGRPAQVKFIDFQRVRYSNPAIDMVFFVYFNMSAELRAAHLDNLLKTYQQAVVDSLLEMTDLPREHLERVYSFENFKEDFEARALYGYIISSMFIHVMLASPEELKDMGKWMQSSEKFDSPSEEHLKDFVKLGGDEATQRSLAILKEIARMKRNLAMCR